MTTGNDVGIVRRLSDDELRGIESFDDAFRAATVVVPDGNVVDASQELGNGFTLLDKSQKRQLIGRETIFVQWDFHESDTVFRADEDGTKIPAEFVSVQAVCKAGKNGAEKFIFNDGSTGIYRMLKEYTERTGRQGGLYAKKGLRVSEYDGPEGRAETFYIDTSA
jgi:hypothetical protein